MPNSPYVTKAEFKSLVDTLDRWRVAVQAKQDKHDKTLYGNGEPGMDENLRLILDWVNEQKKSQESAWSETKKFGIGIAAFIVNTLLAMLIARVFMP